ELHFEGAVQRLQLATDAYVHPAGMTSLSLQRFAGAEFGGEAHQVVLRGAALAAPLVSWMEGIVTPGHVVPGPPTHEAQRWPPVSDRQERSARCHLADSAPEHSVLVGMVRQDDG